MQITKIFAQNLANRIKRINRLSIPQSYPFRNRKIYNIQEPLLYYRIHENQVTYAGGKEGGEYWSKKRNELINDIFLSN